MREQLFFKQKMLFMSNTLDLIRIKIYWVSLDFLFYNLINDTFSDYKFFDFGTSNEKEGRKINSGLLYWKEGFGARSISQNFYEINTADFQKLNNLMI